MGRSARRVVGIAAMVAAPFAAPVVAAKFGVSSLIGTSLIGAGIGAAGSKLAGGRLSQGAIMGGLATGISQGIQGLQAARAAEAGGTALGAAGPATPAGPVAGLGEATNIASGGGVQSTFAPSGLNPALVTGGSALPASATPTGALVASGAQTATPAAGGFMGMLRNAGSSIASRIADPRAAAQLVMMAAGSRFAGDGLTGPEREMLEMARREMEQLREFDREAYEARMAAARQVLDEAERIDPFQEGRMRQGIVQNQVGRAQREQTRAAGLRPGRPMDESVRARQNQVMGQIAGESAFQGGFASGQSRRLAGLQTGASMIPNAPTASMNAMGQMWGPLRDMRQARNEAQTSIGNLAETFSDAFGLWRPNPQPGGNP